MKGKSKPSMEMVRSCDKNDELHLGERKTPNSSIVGPKISRFSTSKGLCYKISVVGGGGQGCASRIFKLLESFLCCFPMTGLKEKESVELQSSCKM